MHNERTELYEKKFLKKLGILVLTLVFSALTTLSVVASSSYILIDGYQIITGNNCKESEEISMVKGAQRIMIHVPRAQSAGNLYVTQYRKGLIFWNKEKTLSWNIEQKNTMRYCSKTFSKTKKDKYFFEFTGINPDTLVSSGLNATVSMAYITID